MWVASFSGEVKSECVDSNQEWSPLSNYAKKKTAELIFPLEVYARWERVHTVLHAALHVEVERHAVKSPLALNGLVYLPDTMSYRHPSSVSWSSEATAACPCAPINCPGAQWLAQVPRASQTVLKMQSTDLPSGIVGCPKCISWN